MLDTQHTSYLTCLQFLASMIQFRFSIFLFIVYLIVRENKTNKQKNAHAILEFEVLYRILFFIHNLSQSTDYHENEAFFLFVSCMRLNVHRDNNMTKKAKKKRIETKGKMNSEQLNSSHNATNNILNTMQASNEFVWLAFES